MTRKLPLHGDLPAASLLLAGIAMSATLVRDDDAQTAALDTGAIDRALGRTSRSIGEVYKVAFLRLVLNVTGKGLALRPGLALTGWAASKAVDGGSVTHGDLVPTVIASYVPAWRATRVDPMMALRCE